MRDKYLHWKEFMSLFDFVQKGVEQFGKAVVETQSWLHYHLPVRPLTWKPFFFPD